MSTGAQLRRSRVDPLLRQLTRKASILKSGRVVFNIKANDYRLVAVVQYDAGVLMIRFFGSHEEGLIPEISKN